MYTNEPSASSEPPASTEPPASSEPTHLFSVNTLLTEREVIVKLESADRELAKSIEFPDIVQLGNKLRQWALHDFPDIYPVLNYSFNCPSICSDGVTRSFADYFQYLVGCSLEEQIQKIETKLDGIRVLCEKTSAKTFNLRVSKA